MKKQRVVISNIFNGIQTRCDFKIFKELKNPNTFQNKNPRTKILD